LKTRFKRRELISGDVVLEVWRSPTLVVVKEFGKHGGRWNLLWLREEVPPLSGFVGLFDIFTAASSDVRETIGVEPDMFNDTSQLRML
jgi:hypothetical protein